MYTPKHFAFPEGATSALQDVIEATGFGVLVAAGDALEATHLPFVLDRARGRFGTLIAHVARANPIWALFAEGQEVLVVFQGAHGYVSPDWYANPGLVPTWNYVAVHAYGVPRILAGDAEVMDALERLSAVMEEGLRPKRPWTMDAVPETTLAALKRGIVAFEIEIARLDGKRKLNQNRTAADRAGVVEALEARGAEGDVALARLMRRLDDT